MARLEWEMSQVIESARHVMRVGGYGSEDDWKGGVEYLCWYHS